MEYVNREAVLKTLKKANIGGYITEKLLEIPTADVQPVKHGKWIRTDKSIGVETVYACSECGYFVRESDRTKYCGDCGTKMDIIYQDDKIRAIKVTG